jgi:hypothetical protein
VLGRTTWERWKSSIQPDGGEGLAKRKGVVERRGLKEALLPDGQGGHVEGATGLRSCSKNWDSASFAYALRRARVLANGILVSVPFGHDRPKTAGMHSNWTNT